MSRRFTDGRFALGLALGIFATLVLFGAVSWLGECPGGNCQSGSAPQGNPNQYKYWVPLATGPDTTSEFDPADREGHEDYYTRQDLRAQESVARATNAMVYLSGLGLLVGILGTGAILWTLVETRRMAEDTSEAVSAAHDANEIMRSEQRPWLYADVSPISTSNFQYLTGGCDDEPVSFCVKVPITLRNSGASPAQNVRVVVEALSLPEAYKAASDLRKAEHGPAIVQKGSVAPGGQIKFQTSACRALNGLPTSGRHDTFMCFLVVATFYNRTTEDSGVDLLSIQNFALGMEFGDEIRAGVSRSDLEDSEPRLVAFQMGGWEMR